MTAAETEALIRRFYQTFGERRLDLLPNVLREDAVWEIPGKSRVAGEHRGRPAILAYMRQLGELSGGTFKATLLDVLGGERHAAAYARATGAREGRSYDARYVLLFTIEDGKIARARLYNEDQAAFDAFWS